MPAILKIFHTSLTVQTLRRGGPALTGKWNVEPLWYGSLVDETEAKRRNRDMEASGLEILGMRPVNGLPPNKLYLEMVKKANEEVSNARNKK